MIKIVPYRIAFVSGEDDESPASDLLNPGPSSRGWATDKYCTYPQVIPKQDFFFIFCRVRVTKAKLRGHSKKFILIIFSRNWE